MSQLVQDHEHWSRRMVEFLDLPWDPHCLRFYERQLDPKRQPLQVRQKVTKHQLIAGAAMSSTSAHG